MIDTIENAVKSGHGNAVLYAGLAGLLLSDIIPTIADAAFFRLQEKNKEKLNNREITPKQYWTREAVYYYGLNPLWWGIVLGSVILTKGTFTDKAKVGIAIIAAGAVVGVLNKNIREDEKKLMNK